MYLTKKAKLVKIFAERRYSKVETAQKLKLSINTIYYYIKRYNILFNKKINRDYRKCLNCNKKLIQYRRDAIFCCHKCYSKYRVKKNSFKYTDDEFFKLSPSSKALLAHLLRTRGNICQWCESSHWQNQLIHLSIYEINIQTPILVCNNCKKYLRTRDKI